MGFCPFEKCEHYSKATKYDRACYYGEPQCWRGWMDLIINLFKLRFTTKRDHESHKSSGKENK